MKDEQSATWSCLEKQEECLCRWMARRSMIGGPSDTQARGRMLRNKEGCANEEV